MRALSDVSAYPHARSNADANVDASGWTNRYTHANPYHHSHSD
jgi:hypothetical protein